MAIDLAGKGVIGMPVGFELSTSRSNVSGSHVDSELIVVRAKRLEEILYNNFCTLDLK